MKRKVTGISTLAKLAKKARVAAYARVSDGKEAMFQSLSAQVNYYKKLISENHMCGCYWYKNTVVHGDNSITFRLNNGNVIKSSTIYNTFVGRFISCGLVMI